MTKPANEAFVDFDVFRRFRRQRAQRSYNNAIEYGSYWLATCIAASNNLGEDRILHAAEREYESAIENRRFQ